MSGGTDTAGQSRRLTSGGEAVAAIEYTLEASPLDDIICIIRRKLYSERGDGGQNKWALPKAHSLFGGFLCFVLVLASKQFPLMSFVQVFDSARPTGAN